MDTQLKIWLDKKLKTYNNIEFIESDPIAIPHLFTKKNDIELSGLYTALIAWGNRKSILKSAKELMKRMDNSPSDFIKNHQNKDLKCFKGFVHRTFNEFDAASLTEMLANVLKKYNSIEDIFCEPLQNSKSNNAFNSITHFRKKLLQHNHEKRFEKHIANPEKGSAAKRLNMFLRWMVRKDKNGVDFGIWNKNFSPSKLMIPLDVHSGRIAREIGLLNRTQNDRKAVEELTANLRIFDSKDPVKYDFAIFGSGIFEKQH